MFTDPRTAATAEATPVKKFMFDHSFAGATAANKPVERKPVLMKPEQIDSLKQESYDEGFTAGHQAGADKQTQALMGLLDRVDERIAAVIVAMEQQHRQQKEQVQHVALAIARKLLPDFTMRNGLQEIYAMLTDAVAEMMHEPRLVVRTHDSEFDAINARIHDITAQKAYAGKVVVLADATIAAGDCRVEWADGGIERNNQSTWQAVDTIMTPDTPR